ncbi:MAG: ThiF family adenylyltransferase [Actinomycetota bacterium]|nr:ThiF family adenylyltransferase [Actinomycetota bacterium]
MDRTKVAGVLLRLRPDVRVIRRDADTWGLERAGTVAWLPAALVDAVWTRPDLLVGPLADVLSRLGFLESSIGNGDEPEGPDRNEVFASTLCDGHGARALRILAERHYVVVGCGGIGSGAAIELAALGARRLTLIDGDRVVHSNRNRLLWSMPGDVGELKVEALASYLGSRFGTDVRAVGRDASEGLLHDLYGAAGPSLSTWLLTVDQADAARGVAGWLHGRSGVQYVHAGYSGARCAVGPFVGDAPDPCPFCGSRQWRLSTERFVAPSAAPNNLLIASFLAAQLLIAGADPGATALRARRWVLDLRTGDVDFAVVEKQSDCEVCRIER